jgi:protein-L-isoaspartate(D-aspartate) O-methyltransferase
MPYIDFVQTIHKKTKRDYLGRVNEIPKATAAAIAKRFGVDYWDGDRKTGYGGFRYDGRWVSVAEELAHHYHLKSGDKVLDIGCGKGFLLYDLMNTVPGLQVCGVDISRYAIDHAKEEVRPYLTEAHASKLPFNTDEFDLVISINTLHNLYCYELDQALFEMERVSKGQSYLVVESYRTEEEKANLLYWQLTCEMFCTPDEWRWWFDKTGYTGDYSFIYFE